jgi:hypothetical protein
MSKTIYTRSECRRAAARLPVTWIRNREGDKKWSVVSTSIYKPAVRLNGTEDERRSKAVTSATCEREYAGAQLLAAGMSVRDRTAAMKRASELWAHWLPFPDTPTFGTVVHDLALMMLRNGWNRKLPEAERKQAESDAEVSLRVLPLVPYYEDPDADAIYAAEHAARVASEYGL